MGLIISSDMPRPTTQRATHHRPISVSCCHQSPGQPPQRAMHFPLMSAPPPPHPPTISQPNLNSPNNTHIHFTYGVKGQLPLGRHARVDLPQLPLRPRTRLALQLRQPLLAVGRLLVFGGLKKWWWWWWWWWGWVQTCVCVWGGGRVGVAGGVGPTRGCLKIRGG